MATRMCLPASSKDERTLITAVLGDLVSETQRITVGQTVKMVVGVEGYK